VCPQEVKVIRNDIDVVKNLFKNNKKVYVSLAPSFISYFSYTSMDEIVNALKKLGFYSVEETAIGATIVKKAYDEMLQEKDRDVIISSCCHSINLLIQKHYPEAKKYLANILSPMLAHGKDIKVRDPEAKVVFIGPCIAKKDEADSNPQIVDAVLTFKELDAWFKNEGISLKEVEYDWKKEESKARLFPITGGILRTMECANKEFQYLAVDGVENSKRVIEDILNGKIHKCFIEMSSCEGSCINGPVSNKAKSVISSYIDINKSAGPKDFKEGKIGYKDISKNYYSIGVKEATPSEEEIEAKLIEMGKKEKSKILNCGSCGYDTCREKAIAIIQGKAALEMCLPYLMEKAESFSDNIVSNSPNGILVLDEELNIQSLNKTMCRIINIEKPSIVIHKNVSSILDPKDFYSALIGELVFRRKSYLSEYNKYIENTVVYDQKFHILLSIMKDITTEEINRQKHEEIVKKSLEITDKVVEKNMRAVQEIASLLGETTAETKVALSSLKDTIKDDK
jgi:uncharacterized Fe-S cluster-containing protein